MRKPFGILFALPFILSPLNAFAAYTPRVVTAPSEKQQMIRARITSGGAITDHSGVSAASRTGTGTYTLTIAAGVFSAAPTCVCIVAGGAGGDVACHENGTTTTTSFGWLTKQNTAVIDLAVNIICLGTR
jgi:hypothetical protein